MYEIDWSFFDNDFFKDLISALIGTGTALLIFYLSIKNDKSKEAENEENQNNQRLNYLVNLAKSSSTQIKTFNGNLLENIQKFKSNNLEFHLIVQNPNKSLERLAEIINNENYFLAYIKKFGLEKTNSYNKISIEVDFFIAVQNQIFEMSKIAQTYDYKRKSDYSLAINKLMNKTASLTTSDYLSEEYVLIIKSILNNLYTNMQDLTNLEYYYINFLQPVLKEVLVKNMGTTEIMQLVSEFKTTSDLFNEIKIQNDHHRSKIEEIQKTYEESFESFKIDANDVLK